MDRRVRNASVFQETTRMCMMEEQLRESIIRSRERQEIFPEDKILPSPLRDMNQEDHVVVSTSRTLAAAMPYVRGGHRVCVLNFANAYNPGGGVLYGANAQEESICRCSTLYMCLDTEENKMGFYNPHKNRPSALGNADIIYTPGVTVFRADTENPSRMPQDAWYNVDVLTCAAPDLKYDDWENSREVDQDEYMEAMEMRIRRIFEVAAYKQADVLILGAFGCGAFGNPPDIVAELFYQVMQEFDGCFETVEYAVFCQPYETANYEAFRKQMLPLLGSSGEANLAEIYSNLEKTSKGSIEIVTADITGLATECIVNAANEYLAPGGGVCGAIFAAAGYEEMKKVCSAYGHCATGSAIVTPGFRLKADYVIHAVGPVYQDGSQGEAGLLASAYMTALNKARSFDIHSIAFPLISSGIYGYPKEEAWEIALTTCREFLNANKEYKMQITFAVLDEQARALGSSILQQLLMKEQEAVLEKKQEVLDSLARQRDKKVNQLRQSTSWAEADKQPVADPAVPAEKDAEAGKTPVADTASTPVDNSGTTSQKEITHMENANMENVNMDKAGMSLMDIIKTRRSIRKFKPDMVSREDIDSIIEAGLYAASGMNRQSPIIIAVTNPVIRNRIAEINARFMGKEDMDPFYGAPVILLVAAQKNPTAAYDGSLTLGNMMLRAHELGLGTCWIHRAYQEIEDSFGKSLLTLLGIEGEFEGVGHLALGYADCELPEAPARREGRVYYI